MHLENILGNGQINVFLNPIKTLNSYMKHASILKFNWHVGIGCSCDFHKKNFTAQGGVGSSVSKGKTPFIYPHKQLLVPSCPKGHDESYCAGSKVHEKQVCKWQVVEKWFMFHGNPFSGSSTRGHLTRRAAGRADRQRLSHWRCCLGLMISWLLSRKSRNTMV